MVPNQMFPLSFSPAPRAKYFLYSDNPGVVPLFPKSSTSSTPRLNGVGYVVCQEGFSYNFFSYVFREPMRTILFNTLVQWIVVCSLLTQVIDVRSGE